MHLETDYLDSYRQYFKERSHCRCAYVEQTFGREVADYISAYVDLADPYTEILSTSEIFNIEIMNTRTINALINLKRINDIRNPNEFIGLINQKLVSGGYFICCAETSYSRTRRILNKYPRIIAYPYYLINFTFKRVLPKIWLTRKISSVLTRGINRVMSLCEIMGRLAACGFEVTDFRLVGHTTYFVCKKVNNPVPVEKDICGLLIKLRRVGKDGKLFNVYKFRTMHPYAEYVQDYVYINNSLEEGCKFRNDFRITSWGRIMRKLWIDEQPMWINWLKRQLKLVGVRPLSQQYFQLYPKALQERRVKHLPGLVPPFYADLPKTFEEVVESENKYLDAYEKHPLMTDIRYLLVAIFNILVKRSRSA